jgi:hypothetical protein
MKIGHICLAPAGSDEGERFAALVEAIAKHDVEQHVLVSSTLLAHRLATHNRVTVGPIVKSPVMAYCLMPQVEIAHVHESTSGQAGLLLTLTKSIPFIITTDPDIANDKNPLTQSVLRRAAYRMPASGTEQGCELARECLSIYANVSCGRLELPKNSDCRH